MEITEEIRIAEIFSRVFELQSGVAQTIEKDETKLQAKKREKECLFTYLCMRHLPEKQKQGMHICTRAALLLAEFRFIHIVELDCN